MGHTHQQYNTGASHAHYQKSTSGHASKNPGHASYLSYKPGRPHRLQGQRSTLQGDPRHDMSMKQNKYFVWLRVLQNQKSAFWALL